MQRRLSNLFQKKKYQMNKTIMLVKEDQLILCQLMEQMMMNGFKCQVNFLLKMLQRI